MRLTFAIVMMTISTIAGAFEEEGAGGARRGFLAPPKIVAEKPASDFQEVKRANRPASNSVTERWFPVLPFTAHAGVNMSQSDFGAFAAINYEIHPFVLLRPEIGYDSLRTLGGKMASRAGLVGVRTELLNPTVIVPFLQGGVGYQSWNAKETGSEDLQGEGVYAGISFGAELRLTANFGMMVERKMIAHMSGEPVEEDGRKLQSPETTAIYFQFSI